MAESTVMEQIVSLCKRRGFVYPASEIYGGLNGFWDYGPLGVLLKNNIRDWWWHNMVITPPIGPDGHPVDIVGLDSAIIQNPKAWVASGHVGGFSDPMVDDRETKQRYRADHLYGLFPTIGPSHPDFGSIAFDFFVRRQPDGSPRAQAAGVVLASSIGEAAALLENDPKSLIVDRQRFGRLIKLEPYSGHEANEHGLKSVWAEFKNSGRTFAFVARLPMEYLRDFIDYIPSPNTGQTKSLTPPRDFNLMFQTYVGAIQDESAKAYLRPETAQGIFLNYKNVIDTTRVKVPFGVAQVGKSFRNEVTPRNFIFRSREFEQMELEWFCHPDEARKWFDFWCQERMRWWRSLGVSESNLRFRQHESDELSHYAKAGVGTADVEYKYPFTAPDFGELEGIAHRTDFDLKAHEQSSGQRLDYFDQDLQVKLKEQGVAADEIKRRSRYHPHVIEPASGLTRAVLVVLCEAYRKEAGRQGTEEYLSIKPRFAPIKAGVFPLVNKDGMPEVAEKLYLDLRQHFTCEYDAKQSIGRRYARMDEIGTPFCVTVDGDTLKDQTVTVRERDTMNQVRVSIDQVRSFLAEKLGA